MSNTKNNQKSTKEFLGKTIGMFAFHPDTKHRLIKVEFNRVGNQVELAAITGINSLRIKNIPSVFVSIEEFDNRPFDYYLDFVEFNWAIRKLGFFKNFEEYQDQFFSVQF